ncbi:hypothetical protein D3C75_1038000 [compost metagenome]
MRLNEFGLRSLSITAAGISRNLIKKWNPATVTCALHHVDRYLHGNLITGGLVHHIKGSRQLEKRAIEQFDVLTRIDR